MVKSSLTFKWLLVFNLVIFFNEIVIFNCTLRISNNILSHHYLIIKRKNKRNQSIFLFLELFDYFIVLCLSFFFLLSYMLRLTKTFLFFNHYFKKKGKMIIHKSKYLMIKVKMIEFVRLQQEKENLSIVCFSKSNYRMIVVH